MEKRPNSNKSTRRKSKTPKKTSDESNESSHRRTKSSPTPIKTIPKTQTILSNRGTEKIPMRTYREMKFFQKTTHLLIPKTCFGKLVKEIMQEIRHDFRLQSKALEALQEATEYYLVDFLMESYMCSIHAKRRTLMKDDINFIRALRGMP